MLDSASCERRVYRLATLLTGNPNAAADVIDRVLEAQPDLTKLDGARMDRLTVLRSREVHAGCIVDQRLPPESARALAELTHQQREAWVLQRVYRVPPRETARAMDCSVTALDLHLGQAERTLAEQQVDGAALAEDLVAYSLTLDVPEFYRRRVRRRRRRWRWVALAIAAAVLAVAAVAIVLLV